MSFDTKDNLREIVDLYKDKPMENVLKELNKVPFFMTEFVEEESDAMEALKALAYDGEPSEVAENFKNQGNDAFKTKQFRDAVTFYTKALDQKSGNTTLEIACYNNRAQANLELHNYRKCVYDCTKVLEIDHSNEKAWYRTCKAFLLVGKLDECVKCCEIASQIKGVAEEVAKFKDAALKRKAELAAREEQLAQAEAAKQREAETLKNALQSRGFTQVFTEKRSESRRTVGDLGPQLEIKTDAQSHLAIPSVVLYPLHAKSDVLQEVSEEATLGDVVDQVLSELPQWAIEAAENYSPQTVDVFLPTISGGLARVGAGFTVRKALGTSKPDIVMVDGMLRLYVVPKTESSEWLKSWTRLEVYPDSM